MTRNWIHNESVYFPYDYLAYVINVPNPSVQPYDIDSAITLSAEYIFMFQRERKKQEKLPH